MSNRSSAAARTLSAAILCAITAAWFGCSSGPMIPRHNGLNDPLMFSRQLIVITTASWDSSMGTLTCYERDDEQAPWRTVAEPMSMVLGSKGFGWGTGLHGGPRGDGPVKHEGDRRSPAGAFALPAIYGYAPAAEARGFAMPYIPLDSTMVCVDDPTSQYYNMVISKTNVPSVDWRSAERMRGKGSWYKWGVVVAHNADPRIGGDGSCIFLHVWGGPTEATTGCTTIDEEQVLKILTWLRPNMFPVLVQMPVREYVRVRPAWHLP